MKSSKLVNIKSIFLLGVLQTLVLIVFVFFISNNAAYKASDSLKEITESPEITPTAAPIRTKVPSPRGVVICDLDGNGRSDKMEIFSTEQFIGSYEEFLDPGKLPFVRAVINGEEFKINLDNRIYYDLDLLVMKLNNDKQVVVLSGDSDPSGSLKYLQAIIFNNNKLELLAVPSIEVYDDRYCSGYFDGFKFKDNYEVEFSIKGKDMVTVVPLQSKKDKHGLIYDDKGKVVEETSGDVYPAYDVILLKENNKEYIKITQKMYAEGYLGRVSTIFTWDENLNLKVIGHEADLY